MKSIITSLLIALFVAHPSLSQYRLPYTESGQPVNALVRVLHDEGGFDQLRADLHAKVLTVTIRADLNASDLLRIAEIVARFYEDTYDGLRDAGIATLRIMWHLAEDDGQSQSYVSGMSIDAKDLTFIARTADALEALKVFWVNFWRLVPPDKYEDDDDFQVGAVDSLTDYRSLEEGDADWFVYRPTVPGLYRVETIRVNEVSDTSPVDTRINVFVGSEAFSDDDDGVGLFSRALVCAGESPIYIEVTSEDSESKPKIGYYRLVVTRSDTQSCSEEDDDPDDATASRDHDIYDRIEGSLHASDDIDWFTLKGLSRGRTYRATLKASSSNIWGRLQAGVRATEDEGIQIRANIGVRFVVKSRSSILLKIAGGEVGTYTVTVLEDSPREL